MMRITTETGSVYEIDNRLCHKYDRNGRLVDAYKIWVMKAVPDDVSTWPEVHKLPLSEPEVGKRLYTEGRDVYWLSTRVVSIEQ